MIWRSCAFVLLLAFCCVGGIGVYFVSPFGSTDNVIETALALVDTPAALDPRPVDFEVTPGEDARSVGNRLKQQGLINDEQIFRVIATRTGLGSRIAAGKYVLRRDMTSRAILERLTKAEVQTRPITVPEGWRLEQVIDHLGKQELGGPEAVKAAVDKLQQTLPASHPAASRPPGQTLEGYLLPETYYIRIESTAEEVVQLMLDTLAERFTPELRQAVAARGLTMHQAITLASIVEREAVKPEERPVIAAVYLNRLKIGMILQADPTVQFALANDPRLRARDGFWKRDLTFDDLKIDSPYNTYRYGGLPPGPICAPGFDSIRAVAAPASNDFLFFVAKPDGSHAFARTLDEHNANVARYLR